MGKDWKDESKKGALRPGAPPPTVYKLKSQLPAVASTATTPSFTASITTEAGPLLLRPGFVDGKAAAVKIRAVQCLDGFLGFLTGAHFDKTKPAGAARELIRNHSRRFHGSVC